MSTYCSRRLSWIAVIAPTVALFAVALSLPGSAAEEPSGTAVESPAIPLPPPTESAPEPAVVQPSPLPLEKKRELAGIPPAKPLAAAPVTPPVLAPAAVLAAPVAPAPAPPAAPQDSVLPSVEFKVTNTNQRLEMTVNSSRMLTLNRPIPQAQVGDKGILSITPMSSKQVQIYAKKPGVTQVNLWDDEDHVYTVDVLVSTDVRELMMQLRAQFPESNITVYPTPNSIILRGYVDRPDDVSRIVAIAQEYNPRVINNMRVGGAQQVLLYVTIAEVNRTKLRNLGVDWANLSTGGSFVISSISGLLRAGAGTGSVFGASLATAGTETFSYGIVGAGNSFFSVLDAMARNQLVKVLASPTLTAISGTPASFQVGGELPILVPAGLGTVSIEFKPFGTQLDYVAVVQGNNSVHLDVKPRITEPDYSLSVTLSGNTVPSFKSREIQTSAELKFGQTLALAGLVQTRVDSARTGLPWVSDLPVIGVMFRRMKETTSEVELLILVRPEAVEPLDCDQVPPALPGETSRSPSDWGIYMRGFVEVPAYHPGPDGAMIHDGPGAEEISPPPVNPSNGPMAPGESTSNRAPRGRMNVAQAQPANSEASRLTDLPRPPLPPPPGSPDVGLDRESESAGGLARRPERNNRATPQRPSSGSAANQKSLTPGFIGPAGYDLNK